MASIRKIICVSMTYRLGVSHRQTKFGTCSGDVQRCSDAQSGDLRPISAYVLLLWTLVAAAPYCWSCITTTYKVCLLLVNTCKSRDSPATCNTTGKQAYSCDPWPTFEDILSLMSLIHLTKTRKKNWQLQLLASDNVF